MRNHKKTIQLFFPLLFLAMVPALALCESACPAGTTPQGAPFPTGRELYCVKGLSDGRIVKEGPLVQWHKNGQVKLQAAFHEDKLHGTAVEWTAKGMKIQEWGYLDGVPSGNFLVRYPDGKPKAQGKFANGKRVGHWGIWAKTGQQLSSGDYVEDKMNGKWQLWYPTGQRQSEEEWEEGRKNGVFKSWYPNGQLKLEAHYLRDNPHGKFIEYFATGAKKQEGIYHQGIKDGLWITYFPNGTKKSAGEFVNGKESGEWTSWKQDGTVSKKGAVRDSVHDAVHDLNRGGEKKESLSSEIERRLKGEDLVVKGGAAHSKEEPEQEGFDFSAGGILRGLGLSGPSATPKTPKDKQNSEQPLLKDRDVEKEGMLLQEKDSE